MGCCKETLVDLVVARDAVITGLRDDLRAERRAHVRDKHRLQLAVAPVQPEPNPNADFMVEYRGRKSSRLTSKSGFAVAQRRNIGNASSKDYESERLRVQHAFKIGPGDQF